MIVRIMGEGQLEVPEDHLDHLNELDAELESAVSSGDESGFRTAMTALLDAVRSAGTPVADDVLVDSDFIMPPADASLEEVREMLTGEGLIPG
ncbi:MAG TPA: hypothetical protein VFL69_01990 [Marmoricola sp.]|nr:hypothetical protein [Marmoricola sp.]